MQKFTKQQYEMYKLVRLLYCGDQQMQDVTNSKIKTMKSEVCVISTTVSKEVYVVSCDLISPLEQVHGEKIK